MRYLVGKDEVGLNLKREIRVGSDSKKTNEPDRLSCTACWVNVSEATVLMCSFIGRG
ncbi:MAG: hypothetical protein ACI9T7_002044 [Oleiphilaceae bacterium]|jgi:hypothetical protein